MSTLTAFCLGVLAGWVIVAVVVVVGLWLVGSVQADDEEFR